MLYRYEIHCHCSQCSACAHSTSRELVRAFYNAGYAGIVLTDHFIFGSTCVDRSLPWAERMSCYYNAYLEARDEASSLDFDVIFGLEHAYDGREVLCHGLDLDFLLSNPDIPEIDLAEFSRRVRKYGGMVIQAHPLRNRAKLPEVIPLGTDIVDGIEVFNAHNELEENLNALSYARENRSVGDKRFVLTSGGDIHHSTDELIGSAGILLPFRVSNGHELVSALKNCVHLLNINGKSLVPAEIGEEHFM